MTPESPKPARDREFNSRAESERVAITPCIGYEKGQVAFAIDQAVDLLGGWRNLVPVDDEIYIKPNLAGPFAPDRAVTTHPMIVETVARVLRSKGADIIVGDGPAGVPSPTYLKLVYKRTGMISLGNRLNIPIDYDTIPEEITIQHPRAIRCLTLTRSMISRTNMISLPKFKTHLFVRMTGAVKNLYGVVHGLTKVAYHSKYKDPGDFTALLLDLVDLVRPRLTIVDAVMGMEGDGPTWGRPRFVGYILAGTDPLSVDYVMSRMMGFPEKELPLFQVVSPPKVEVVGVPLNKAVLKGFRLPQPNTMRDGLEGLQWIPHRLKEAFCRELLPRPNIDSGQCISCGLCLKSCPQQAIHMTKAGASVNHSRCIRCWCCNEVCPSAAVRPERSLLGRMLSGFR